MKQLIYLGAVIVFVILIFAAVRVASNMRAADLGPGQGSQQPPGGPGSSQGLLLPPLTRWTERVTKKTFGTYVRPGASPVDPEKFTGYHSAIDLEILDGEADAEVPVAAVCDGKMAVKRMAQGYGGVVAQYCTLQGQDVLVIYGHLALASVPANVGDDIKAGDRVGNLGQPGPDTDDERKHLHLGVRKGHDLVILGYVDSPSGLEDYLDPRDLIPRT